MDRLQPKGRVAGRATWNREPSLKPTAGQGADSRRAAELAVAQERSKAAAQSYTSATVFDHEIDPMSGATGSPHHLTDEDDHSLLDLCSSSGNPSSLPALDELSGQA